MYNRYIRNDQGVYTRIPEEEPPLPHQSPESRSERRKEPSRPSDSHSEHRKEFHPPMQNSSPEHDGLAGISQTLRRFLDRLHLEKVDTGDLLLLVLLFLLFEEEADDELLIALGLLLIL